MAGQGSDSTGQDVEEEVPSVAPGLGAGQGTASGVAGTAFSPRAPGATDSLPGPPGMLPPDSTMEPLFWPMPTEGPTGHIEWQASLPTRDTLPAPLDPTWPQTLDPGATSQDLPSAPTPEPLKTSACGEWQEWCPRGAVWSHMRCEFPWAQAHSGAVQAIGQHRGGRSLHSGQAWCSAALPLGRRLPVSLGRELALPTCPPAPPPPS